MSKPVRFVFRGVRQANQNTPIVSKMNVENYQYYSHFSSVFVQIHTYYRVLLKLCKNFTQFLSFIINIIQLRIPPAFYRDYFNIIKTEDGTSDYFIRKNPFFILTSKEN